MHQLELPIRNASLYSALRSFVDAAFVLLREDVERGADVDFSVAEHRKLDDPIAMYEYRPMTEAFVDARLDRIAQLKVTQDSAWAIASDPACSAFLRAGRADVLSDLEDVARNEILWPLLGAMAELHPDFDLDEDSLLRHYLRFEQALYSEQRRYASVTPLWGVRLVYGDLQLAGGVRLRQVDPVLFRQEWPEAAQLNWSGATEDGLPTAMLEFERAVTPDDDSATLDPLPAIDQVVSVIRALAGGSVHAGPLVYERLDFRNLAPRPVMATAARPCGAVPSRIDATIAKALPGALRRLSSDPHGPIGRALERYQLAATAFGMGALRTVFDTIVDIYAGERETGSAALRMAMVVGSSLPDRLQYVAAMTDADRVIREAQPPTDRSAELTRLLASALRATIAAALVGDLPLAGLRDYADSVLLGERDRKRLGIATMQVDVEQATMTDLVSLTVVRDEPTAQIIAAPGLPDDSTRRPRPRRLTD